jgi:hypothetical protein
MVPALDANGWRVVIAVAEAARAGAAAAVVVQAGSERVTTPNPAGLADVTVCDGTGAGGPDVWLSQAALKSATPSSTMSGNALRPRLITGSRYRSSSWVPG